MRWWERWSALSVAGLLLLGSAVALAQEETDGASAFGAAGFIVLGAWLTAELWDRFRDGGGDG